MGLDTSQEQERKANEVSASRAALEKSSLKSHSLQQKTLVIKAEKQNKGKKVKNEATCRPVEKMTRPKDGQSKQGKLTFEAGKTQDHEK